MTVLVVGGAGYIGVHIVDLLCNKGYKVIVFDNLTSGFTENLNLLSNFIEGDILNNSDLDFVFSNHKIDLVIHMAACKSVEDSIRNPSKYIENNIDGSINLISQAIKYKVDYFIFSSSAAVYGNPIYSPIDERHPTEPTNNYGKTKLYIEEYLKSVSKKERIKFVALRYFNAAGYSEKKNLIKLKESNPKNLLPIIMEVANRTRAQLNIYGNNYNTKDRTCIRDYVHVLDLADAHIKAINYLDTNDDSSIINLSTGIGYSVLDIVKITEEVTKKKIPYNFSSRREGDSPTLISTFNKAKEVLDWNPQYSINDIISSMWNIYEKDLK